MHEPGHPSPAAEAAARTVGGAPRGWADAQPAGPSDAAALAGMMGNQAFCRHLVARKPPIAPPNRQLPPGPPSPPLPAGVEMVDLAKIEYTQPGISFHTKDQTVGQMASQMQKTGWDVSRPADIVRMPDGRLVSLDHRRLWAAARAGNIRQISAHVHADTELASPATQKRFAIGKDVPSGTNPVTKQPWKAGDKPKTWGDVVRFRSAVQGFGKAGSTGHMGYNPSLLPGGGVRDPSFPAEGSKDPPMRVQPGPYKWEQYPAGGTVIKSGNRRTAVPSGVIVEGSIEAPAKPPSGGGAPPPSQPPTTTTPARGSPYAPKTTFEPAIPRPIVETSPPVTATARATTSAGGAPVGKAANPIRLGTLRLAGSVATVAALWWLASKLGAHERKRVAAKIKEEVDPKVQRHLAVRLAAEAERLTLEEPLMPVYAIVNVEMDYVGILRAGGYSETIQDVRFVGVTGVSRDKVHKEATVSEASYYDPRLAGYGEAKTGVRRVTYSTEVSFEDPTGELARRKEAVLDERRKKRAAEENARTEGRLLAEVAAEAEAGRSARRHSDVGDAGAITAEEVAERMNPWADHISRHERQKAAKVRRVRAYLKYTTGRKHLAGLHADAARYLDELEGRRSPEKPGPMDLPGVRDPADEKAMKDWLKATQGP